MDRKGFGGNKRSDVAGERDYQGREEESDGIRNVERRRR